MNATTNAATDAKALWEAYQRDRDPVSRERLLAFHLRLVHHVARKLARTLSVDAELDDLVSAGTIGLINAIENYDPTRGLAFSTFAAPRIRGAILDDLRRWDHVPRSVRRKQRQIAAAREALQNELNREPRPEETARELGIEVETYWRWEHDTQDAVHISLDRPLESREGTKVTPLDVLIGEDGEAIEDDIAHREEVRILREEILRLRERDRLVITLYYFEELKLRQIAEILDLTESRVSQIRSKAVETLKDRMRRLRKEDA